jgi:hypothetical protein
MQKCNALIYGAPVAKYISFRLSQQHAVSQDAEAKHICMLAANAATSAGSSRTPTRATKNQGPFAGIPPLRPQFNMPRYVPLRRDYNYRIISMNLARIRHQPAGKYSTGRSK